MALAGRERSATSAERRRGRRPSPPDAVLKMAERVVSEGDARAAASGGDLGPEDARALLSAWLDSVGLDLTPARADRATCRPTGSATPTSSAARAARTSARCAVRSRGAVAAAASAGGRRRTPAALFDACVPAIPYAPAATFLGREKAKLAPRDGEPAAGRAGRRRVGAMHGVTHTIERDPRARRPRLRGRGDRHRPNVDRRLPAVAEVEIPFYAGLRIGVPSLPAMVEMLAEAATTWSTWPRPGPAGIAAALIARIRGLPLLGSYHTELAAYAGLRTGDPALEHGMRIALGLLRAVRRVLSPSPAATRRWRRSGSREGIGRWERGVDLARFDPRGATRTPTPARSRSSTPAG